MAAATPQDLENIKLDAITIEQVSNGDETAMAQPRLGGAPIPSLRKIVAPYLNVAEAVAASAVNSSLSLGYKGEAYIYSISGLEYRNDALNFKNIASEASSEALGSKEAAANSVILSNQVKTATEVIRDQILTGIGSNKIFLSVAAGEAATANGELFKVYIGSTGLVTVRQRTISGSDALYLETTTASLNYQAAHTFANGALGDNAANDTPSIQTILASANVTIDPGTNKVQPDTLNGSVFRNQATTAEYTALVLNGSRKTINGPGTLRTATRIGGVVDEIQFGLATPQNAGRGAQTDITVDGLTFSVENGSGGTNTNQRGAHFIGVDRLSLLNTTFLTTINRRGAGVYVDNSRYVLMGNFRFDRVSGGFNTKYSDDIAIGVGIVNNVNEGFDFDGTGRGLAFGIVAFKGDGTRTQQPLDINGQRDAAFSALTLNGYGGITISYKKTTSPDFTTFLAYKSRVKNKAYSVGEKIIVGNARYNCSTAGVSSNNADSVDFTLASQATFSNVIDGTVTWTFETDPYLQNPPVRISLSGVSGSQMGAVNNHLLVIGNEWNDANYIRHDSYAPATDIVISDWLFNDTTPIVILEVTRGRLHGVHLSDVIMPANVSQAAITAKSGINTSGSAYEWSDLTLSVRDTIVERVPLGGMAFTYPRRLLIDGCQTLKCNQNAVANTKDLLIGNLEARGAKIILTNNEFEGDIQISGNSSLQTAWAANTQVYKNMVRTNDSGKFYRAIKSGITAASGGPTGTSKTIADGTAIWEYMEEPYSVIFRNNKVGGTLVVGGDAHKFIHGRSININIGDLPALGTKRFGFVAKKRMMLLRATLVSTEDAAANATNYRRFYLKTNKSGVVATLNSQLLNASGLTAFIPREMFAVGHYGQQALIEKGEAFYIESDVVGSTGMALSNLSAEIEVVELS